MNSNLTKLAALRASGAITQEQYEQLLEGASAPPQAPQSGRDDRQSLPLSRDTGASLIQIVAAATGGALAGSLAADLLRNALTDPPPEVLDAHIQTHTTFTDTGYVTESNITWENGDGELVAQETFTEQEAWALESDDPYPRAGTEVNEMGGYGDADFGGMEF